MKTKSSFIKISLLLLLLLPLVFSCNNDTNAWEKAKQQNTIEAYKDFIGEFPKSEFINEAGNKITEIEWLGVETSEDLDALKEFVSHHPNSKYSEKAENIITDLKWVKACNDNNIESLQKFLIDHPKSKYASEAENIIIDLMWAKSCNENNIESFQKFLIDHPKSKYSLEAEQKIIDLEWQVALKKNRRESYNKFITKYPDTRYAEVANQKIAELELNWENGFLEKKYPYGRDIIEEKINIIFSRCLAYSRQSIENGIINTFGVGDENGKWSLNGEGGMVSVKRVNGNNHVLVGFKVNNGDKKASQYFHRLLTDKLSENK